MRKAKLSIDIEVTKERYREGGRWRTRYRARIGRIDALGGTEAEAKRSLAGLLQSHAEEPTPTMALSLDGKCAVMAHRAECDSESVCFAILRPGYSSPAYTMQRRDPVRTLAEEARHYLRAVE